MIPAKLNHDRPTSRLAARAILLSLVFSGCTTETIGRAGSSTDKRVDGRPANVAAGTSRSTLVRAAILPLSQSIPYDGVVLPLTSPDGNFIATQSGVPPTWDTLLANPGASPPAATAIQIFRVDLASRHVEAATMLTEPCVLGRSCDDRGFLVESPREDGSRWIGHASWTTGQIDWLVKDEHVNAFAAIGPRGELAWCRRGTDRLWFELAVRSGGTEWSVDADEGEWLMPSWSGDKLFVLRTVRGRMEAHMLFATGEAAMTQSIGHHSLQLAGSAATRYVAWQTVAGQPATLLRAQPRQNELIFFHPTHLGTAIWRPMSSRGRVPIFLERRSVAAVVDDSDYVVYLLGESLMRRRLGDEKDKAELLGGAFVPRHTNDAQWPFLLLLIDPESPQSLSVTAMALLGADETAQRDQPRG
jgi:hypothetical protein